MKRVALQVAVLVACVAIVAVFRNPVSLGLGFGIGLMVFFNLLGPEARPLRHHLRQRRLDRRRP
jgi:hypothetical protein